MTDVTMGFCPTCPALWIALLAILAWALVGARLVRSGNSSRIASPPHRVIFEIVADLADSIAPSPVQRWLVRAAARRLDPRGDDDDSGARPVRACRPSEGHSSRLPVL